VLFGFISLYAALFSAFGFSSPSLPAFLAERGLKPEQLGVVLGAATALRLVYGPVAGRLADRFPFLRAELAVCAALALTAMSWRLAWCSRCTASHLRFSISQLRVALRAFRNG
jgi:MFS transporter, PPP family, 3-phenylpropionic acid transporter